jgi:hypothetical protein
MNYLDWLMLKLNPDELTPQNVDEIVVYLKARLKRGCKVRKY